MLNAAQIEAAAKRLDQAETSLLQTELMSVTYPDMTMEDAYAIQYGWVDQKIARGRKVIGHKIGLTSRAMQQALNIDIPDSGILFDDMLFENGATIPQGRFIQPRIEAEIAFVMKQDLSGDNLTVADVLDATDYIAPSLEILDTRIFRKCPKTGVQRIVFDTISDNAANAGIVLGSGKANPRDVDMRWLGAILSVNGNVESTGLGAAVLNDPALSVLWLAQRLAQYNDTIRAGEIILSGSFIAPIETKSGDHFNADFGDFGSVDLHFE